MRSGRNGSISFVRSQKVSAASGACPGVSVSEAVSQRKRWSGFAKMRRLDFFEAILAILYPGFYVICADFWGYEGWGESIPKKPKKIQPRWLF